MVANYAIVRDVSVDHQEVIVSDLGDAATLNRAAMDRHALQDSVAITYAYERRFPSVFHVLVVFANRSEGINYVVSTNARMPAYNDVGLEYRAFTNPGMVADAAIGANADASANDSALFNNCGRIDDSGLIDHEFSPSGLPPLAAFGLAALLPE
jgi:hypothetical protein